MKPADYLFIYLFFIYYPLSQAVPEIAVVSNVRALQQEEVGAMASTEEMLVAPEEVSVERENLMQREAGPPEWVKRILRGLFLRLVGVFLPLRMPFAVEK